MSSFFFPYHLVENSDDAMESVYYLRLIKISSLWSIDNISHRMFCVEWKLHTQKKLFISFLWGVYLLLLVLLRKVTRSEIRNLFSSGLRYALGHESHFLPLILLYIFLSVYVVGKWRCLLLLLLPLQPSVIQQQQ